jgi:hypothetical protein
VEHSKVNVRTVNSKDQPYAPQIFTTRYLFDRYVSHSGQLVMDTKTFPTDRALLGGMYASSRMVSTISRILGLVLRYFDVQRNPSSSGAGMHGCTVTLPRFKHKSCAVSYQQPSCLVGSSLQR